MTETEKMLTGKPHIWDEEVFENLNCTQELLFDFNTLRPNEIDKRNAIIRKLFGQIGKKFCIRSPFYCYFGNKIFVGENFIANFNCFILDNSKVTIGDNVMLAPNVRLFTGGHPIHPEPRKVGSCYAFPITIGNNVWIGGGSIVNPGNTIGDNTVIGSGSVVTKDIPANVLAVGNPCRVIREITDDDRHYFYKKLKFEE
jgi:acetyltransferase-like isoleucine patch superfamily enzyme